MLIYEAVDADFAAAAVEALEKAGIAAYRTGGGQSYPLNDPTICIYIRHAADYTRANKILIEQGAVVDKPARIGAVLLTVGAIALFALIAAIASGNLK